MPYAKGIRGNGGWNFRHQHQQAGKIIQAGGPVWRDSVAQPISIASQVHPTLPLQMMTTLSYDKKEAGLWLG